jgi:oxygen-dependent protoporphyrinogen oxidase
MRVIVVGGGIAGLGAAWRLRELGHEVVLLERHAEPGGRCRSVPWHGQWAATGAVAFLGAEANLLEQARKLGIDGPADIVDVSAAQRWNVLVKRTEAVDFGGFDLAAAARHRLIPLADKARLLTALPRLARLTMAADPREITSTAALDDEDACAYFRRLSPTFVDYFLEPCMGMFCGYGDEGYSLAWLAWSSSGRLAWSGNHVWTFRERGTGRLTWEMGRQLAADPGVELRLGTRALAVHERAHGVRVEIDDRGACAPLDADAAVVAVPGNRIAGLLPGLDPARREFLSGIDYAGHHIVYYLLDRPQGDLLDTYVLPAADGFRRTGNLRFTDLGNGTTFAHSQWKDHGCRQHADASDEELLDIAWSDVVEAVPRLQGTRVIDAFVSRQPDAICKRPKGYIRRLGAFSQLGPLPRIAFCGDWLSNSTVGQSHWTGLQAAESLVARLA